MNLDNVNKVDGAVGLTMSRLEAWEKANGAAIFTEDMVLAGMLHGALALSKVAHARILGYEISAALRCLGQGGADGDDFESRIWGSWSRTRPCSPRAKSAISGSRWRRSRRSMPRTARAAARLIEVIYEELPAVFTIEQAVAAHAPVLHEDFDSYFKIYDASTRRTPNELALSTLRRGDIVQGFAESDVILDQVYETSAQYHAYLEPAAALASVDGRGKVTVWSSTPERLPHPGQCP